MAKRFVTVKIDERSKTRVEQQIERLLAASRHRAPKIVKSLANRAANSAARLTLPNKSKKSIGSVTGSESPRKPTLADKMRPVVSASQVFHGQFFVVNKARKGGKRKNKKPRNSVGTMNLMGKKVMRGSNGEVVIYTTKKISQKNKDFKKVKRLIKAWDKKKKRFRYIPTITAGNKYDRKSKLGKIPYYFSAKQAWLYSAARISRTIKKLNKAGVLTRLGTMTNGLSNRDKPSVILHNNSKYAHKKGGNRVPAKAVARALRSWKHSLEKQERLKILRAAKRG